MFSLVALILASPGLGLHLQTPTLHVPAAALEAAVGLDHSSELALHADLGALALDAGLEADLGLIAALPLQAEGATPEISDEDRRYAEAVRQRAEWGQIHRALGIATWASMTLTVALGFIQYYNLYGIGAGQNENPCASGNAVFGQDQCWGVPWPHMASAAVTTGLYGVTLGFSIGLLLNDPNDVLNGRGQYSERMRIHSVLALIHLAGMLAQTFIGVGVANNWFGDRTNDYNTLRDWAAVHQVVGWTTWGALGAAGALMLF